MRQSNRRCVARRSLCPTAPRMLKNGFTPGRRWAGSAAWKNPRKLQRPRRVRRRPEESSLIHEQTWQSDSAHVRRIREGRHRPAIPIPAARPRVLGLATLSEWLGENAQPAESYRIFLESRIACAARHGYLRLIIRIRLRNSAGARLALAHRGAGPHDRYVHGLLDSGS